MNDEQLTAADSNVDAGHRADAQTRQMSQGADNASSREPVHTVAIAATFTADPIQRPLQFWFEKLAIVAEIQLAPYAQVMQELLHPSSLFARNTCGLNVLLIRLEDWVQDRLAEGTQRNLEHLQQVADELVSAVNSLRARTTTSLFIFLCPPSSLLPEVYRTKLAEVQAELLSRLAGLARTYCWTHADLESLYSLGHYEDARAERIGHIPYSQEYFVAIATLFARRIAVLLKPQYKVIAIDCDNTLWRGICGEDGATGVQITPAHIELQRALVRQYEAGVLLCLCSKNNPADVEAVFRTHPQMPLRDEHLICSRVNWESKSSNLQSLAQELDLSLDSFILIDDSPLECAEVRAQHPEVLALELPHDEQGIAHFVRHVWAFDRVASTAEARQRTAQYRQNRARTQALRHATDLQAFLASLDLSVTVAPLQASQLARVAELVLRTNQFNLSGTRRRAEDIEALWLSRQLRIATVHVRDRFGDYGLVGALFLRRQPAALDVDTFVLSCRVLGRGVEHRIANELGRMAREEDAAEIILRFRRTPRNAPAQTFLETSFGRFRAVTSEAADGEQLFVVPAMYAESLGGETAAGDPSGDNPASGQADGARAPISTAWHEAAYRYSRIADIVAEMNRSTSREDRARAEYVAPRSSTEATIAAIWVKILGLSEVGIRDDFFELGGDSVRAVQVLSGIGSVLGLELPIHEFFDAPTVEAIAAKLADATQYDDPIDHNEGAGAVPLSSAQQRLWFIDRLEGGSAAYHIPLAMRLQGPLNLAALQSALNELMRRHEMLRTVFVLMDGQPMQQVLPEVRFALQPIDLTGRSPDERSHAVLEQSREELMSPFELSTGPLIRGRLLALTQTEHVLLITMHHIASDGWSLGIFFRELALVYQAYCASRSDPLPPLPIQYADFARWQRRWLEGRQLREQLRYWHEHLRGAPEFLELSTDRPRPAVQSYQGAVARVSLSADLTAALRTLSRRSNLTLAMTLFTAWTILLSRLSGQEDIVVGMPVASRRRTELEGLIGLFVNTLAVRVRLEDDPPVIELLQRVRETMIAAYAHQDVPFERVVEAVQPARSLSRSPVFQAMFVLHNTPRAEVQVPGLTLVEEEVPLQTTKFDVTLSLQETADGIFGSLNYASDLFDGATIVRWIDGLQILLRGMVNETHLPVSRLALVSQREWRKVTESFNAKPAAYPHEKLLHELFEEQAERTPNALAVLYEGQSLTFAELNARANQLARHLILNGLGPEQLVGICVGRSLDLVVGLLGTLKAGGAYVPLDPEYPRERLAYIIDDCHPRVLLTQQYLQAGLPARTAEVIAIDARWGEIARHSSANLGGRALGQRSDCLAYVIYTSGSTGKPKGVMIEHRNVVSLWQGLEQIYRGCERCERIAVNASFNFDASVKQLVQVISGRTLVIVPQEHRWDPARLLALIDEQRIDGIDCTPWQLRSWIAAGLLTQTGHALRVALVGGEPVDPELWHTLAQCSRTRFCNVYGPTESTVDATFAYVEGDAAKPHIGAPMENRSVYILDRHLQPVPIGVIGELYIGGAGVARGYLNRPELTAQRFVRDDFSADPQARMYKTGDVGRWCADGTIEYLGRNDHQVKVRGFRIELGEIEALLSRHEQVAEAVVIARENVPGEKQLAAYVVPRAAAGPSIESLRTHLCGALPEYMVPSAFVILERMPLTPNGKLDRRALPAPELGAYASRRYEPPQGEVEEILAGVWQGLLRVERIGRHDNFFELGGHSLLIVQMLERLRRVGLSAQVRRVFESPTLADLASALTREAVGDHAVSPSLIPSPCETITPQMLPLVDLEPAHIERLVQAVPGGAANVQDIYPLDPLQEGILFHHLLTEGSGDTYIVPIVLQVASRARLDELVIAVQAVIDRHDILRSAVFWEQLPRPVQVVYRRAVLPVEEATLDPERAASAQIEEWIKPARQRMSLAHAPLMRLRVACDQRSGHWYAVLQSHHITSDHVTLEIITEEVVGHLQGRAQKLPGSVPYRNHVAQVLAYAQTHDTESFFRSKLGDIEEPTAPFGLLDVHGDGSSIEERRAELPAELAKRIRVQARRLGVSSATLFHAAWGIVVARTSGRDDVVFGSVLLGRLQGSAGAQRILGMFINTLPLRMKLSGVSARELVEHTQRELIELLSHEQASLATAQRCSGLGGTAPLFTTLLNYRHSIPNPEVQWSGAAGIRAITVQERTNYPLTFSVDDLGEGFTLTAQTDRRLDALRIISYLHTAVSSLVDALEEAPQTAALALCVLPESERRELLEAFNATAAEYPHDKLIHEVFEQHAQATPHAPAVICADQTLTYRELNVRANQLARYLRAQGLAPGEFVPILMERSLQMLVSQIAVLKSGSVYVPVDPELPPERRSFIIRDCGAKHVLVDDASPYGTLAGVQWIDCAAVVAAIASQCTDDLALHFDPLPPAYVMYTSGSTGQPKGVIVPHHAVNRLAINNGYATFTAADCIAHHSNPAFDASTFEIWAALLNGARVVIVSQAVLLDVQRFRELLRRTQVTALYMSVGLFNQYSESMAEVFTRLRYLMVGGESLEPGSIRRVLLNSPPRQLLNVYGPTECTTFSTKHVIESVEEGAKSIPIGVPIANARIYLTDSARQLVPVGVVGEMYIGGAGVACGYLNRPELTSARFVPDPLDADPGARLYRTGDLARWRADGVIEFLGRNDHQVKIRGFRVELGEIEAQLARHPAVHEAVVLAREDLPGEKRLVAYIVAREPANPPRAEELRAYLKEGLPSYMVPGAFVSLQAMPLTPTGKVNRRALPMPAGAVYASREYEPPKGDIEQTLAGVWQEVLGVSEVGRSDHFFDLGGHSLLALQVLSTIKRALGCPLRVRDLYSSPTLKELALRIREGSSSEEIVDLASEAQLDPDIVATAEPRAVPPRAVFLTGATGFVGRFLLAHLLAETDALVYCLVRAHSERHAGMRLRMTLSRWDLWRDEFEGRVIGVPGDLRLPHLGMSEPSYQLLSRSVDSIYHCGTSMNHLETYSMAKAASVAAANELLKFATQQRSKLVNYVSTLAVFRAATTEHARVIDETTPIEPECHSTANGYAASKWVADKIFLLARERGIPCNIFRLGLVWADAERGRYDELQREYRIFKTCLLSGYGIKNYRHDMPPTAADFVVRAIVTLAGRHAEGGGVFHVCSPLQLVERVFERCNEIAGTALELLPYYDWVMKIKRCHEEGCSYPAVPLIEFAFALDRQDFVSRQAASARLRFDCSRTLAELAGAGITAPVLDDELLQKALADMFARDTQLQELAEHHDHVGTVDPADPQPVERMRFSGAAAASTIAK